jgi:hypothetical protein
MKPASIAFLLAPIVATAQTTTAPPPATPSPSRPAAHAPPSRSWTNPQLHLTFTYPADLAPRDPKFAAAAVHRVIYGEDTVPDSDPRSLPFCATMLLSIGTPPAPQSAKATAPSAKIAIFDVDAQCIPPEALRKKSAMNDLLKRLASQGITFLGMMPIDEPSSYQIQGHRLQLAAAQGTPATTTGLQTAGALLTAVAATAVNGHVLCWVIEADDLPLFNRLLMSTLDFGAGPAQPLFPLQFSGSD